MAKLAIVIHKIFIILSGLIQLLFIFVGLKSVFIPALSTAAAVSDAEARQ